MTQALRSKPLQFAPRPVSAPYRLANDRHSGLNLTRVAGIERPRSPDELCDIVRRLRAGGQAVSIGGGLHAMGGQQFARNRILIDTSALNKLEEFDGDRGTIEVQAGMRWPQLIELTHALQPRVKAPWTIRQKQTGADMLTIGGSVGANIHSRGLRMQPFVQDIESLRVLCADGCIRECSRRRDSALFSRVIGGYGLFGAVLSARLRLQRRLILRRSVKVIDSPELISSFGEAIAAGALYGDFQFSCDEKSEQFLRRGVFSSYAPDPEISAIPENQDALSPERWKELVYLAHVDKARAFSVYAEHYLRTHGQLYYSDTMQLATYLDQYHTALDLRLGSRCRGSEMITEVYVPRHRLARFMADAAVMLRRLGAHLIYGTVRLIQKDTETFLPWATGDFACVIFNLHVDHAPESIAKAADQFRALIDIGLSYNGSYYLTYHRFARRDQLLRAYPRFNELLKSKLEYDPDEFFTSDWYEHYRRLLA